MAGLLLLLLTGMVLAQHPAPRKPDVQWGLTPDPVIAGQSLTVTVAPFGAKGRCDAFIRFQGGRTSVECGLRTVKFALPPVESSTAKVVVVNLSACLPGGPDPKTRFTCWSFEKSVRRLPGSVAAPARPAAKPAPAAAPAPEGAISETAAAPVREVKEGAPILARTPSRAGIDAELLDKLSGSPHIREVRGLDGRMYTVADPPEGSVQAKDDRYRLALLKDDQVRRAYDGWGGLDEQAKLAALQRASALQAESYGISPVPVELGPISSPGTLAHYSPASHKITVDSSKRFLKDPDMAFNVISHESRHSYQHQLVERLNAGKLAAGSEEAALAEGFKKSFADYCCVKCRRSCDYPTYRDQLVERDAFEQGEAATVYLGSELSRATYNEYLAGVPPAGGR